MTFAPRALAALMALNMGVQECFLGLWPNKTIQLVLA